MQARCWLAYDAWGATIAPTDIAPTNIAPTDNVAVAIGSFMTSLRFGRVRQQSGRRSCYELASCDELAWRVDQNQALARSRSFSSGLVNRPVPNRCVDRNPAGSVFKCDKYKPARSSKFGRAHFVVKHDAAFVGIASERCQRILQHSTEKSRLLHIKKASARGLGMGS
jgi:hypothetical protein